MLVESVKHGLIRFIEYLVLGFLLLPAIIFFTLIFMFAGFVYLYQQSIYSSQKDSAVVNLIREIISDPDRTERIAHLDELLDQDVAAVCTYGPYGDPRRDSYKDLPILVPESIQYDSSWHKDGVASLVYLDSGNTVISFEKFFLYKGKVRWSREMHSGSFCVDRGNAQIRYAKVDRHVDFALEKIFAKDGGQIQSE